MDRCIYCPHCGKSFKMCSRKKKRAPSVERTPVVEKQKVSSEGKKDTSSDEGIRRKFDDVKYLIE